MWAFLCCYPGLPMSGLWAGFWFISPLFGVWARGSLVGLSVGLNVGSGWLLVVFSDVVVAFSSFWGGGGEGFHLMFFVSG